MMKLVVLVTLVALAAAAPNPHGGGGLGLESSSGCRYWCKTPEGQAYCCQTDYQPLEAIGVKRTGLCPPVRPKCPPTRFGPPKTCADDGGCPGVEKCCFDRCLENHVCKTPIY